MKKEYQITVTVDEDIIKENTGLDAEEFDIIDAIKAEMSWVKESGIFVDKVEDTDGIFCTIRWHRDDLEEVFKDHGIPYTDENIDAFINTRAPRTLEERSTEDGWGTLNYLVCLEKRDGTLVK